MNLATTLFQLYCEGDITIDSDDVPSYNTAAITELQGFWNQHMRSCGTFDINKIEETVAYAILRRHHAAIDEDRSWMDRLSAYNARTH